MRLYAGSCPPYRFADDKLISHAWRAVLGISKLATLTGFEPTFDISQLCAITAQLCVVMHVRCNRSLGRDCAYCAPKRSFSVRICPNSLMTLSIATQKTASSANWKQYVSQKIQRGQMKFVSRADNLALAWTLLATITSRGCFG